MILKIQGNEVSQCELFLQGTTSEVWATDPMGKHFNSCPSTSLSWNWRYQALLVVFTYLSLSHPLAVRPCTSLSTTCDAEKLL